MWFTAYISAQNNNTASTKLVRLIMILRKTTSGNCIWSYIQILVLEIKKKKKIVLVRLFHRAVFLHHINFKPTQTYVVLKHAAIFSPNMAFDIRETHSQTCHTTECCCHILLSQMWSSVVAVLRLH